MTAEKKILKILLVEDNQGDARLFSELISPSKAEIHNVPTLNEAKIELRGNDYDLIILDLGLPDSAGIETFHEISGVLENIPIIVLTGNLDEELGKAVVRLGGQDFLNKNQIDEFSLNKSIDYAIERFASQGEVKRKEKKFRDLIAENPDGVVILNSRNNRILYLNETGENLLNIKSEEALGEELNLLADVENQTELNIPEPGGGFKVIALNMSNTTWEDNPARIVTLRDITELRAQQERIAHLNKLLKTIGNINHLIVNQKDPDVLLETACRHLGEGRSYKSAWIGLCQDDGQIEKVFHYGLKEDDQKFKEYVQDRGDLYCSKELFNSGEDILEITNSSETCGDCPLSQLKTNGEGIAVKIRHEKKDYGILVATRHTNLLGSKEEESLLKEVAADIGLALHTLEIERAKKESGEKLQESERFAKSTMDSIPKHISVINEKGEIIAVNKAWKDFALQNDADLTEVAEGSNYIAVCQKAAAEGDETAHIILDKIHKIIDGKESRFSLEYPCHSPSEKRWFHVNISPFKGEGPVRLVITHDNITKLKLASKQVVENEKKFRSLFNLSPDIIAIQNLKRKIIECNDTAVKKLGYSREELLNLKVDDLQKFYLDDELKEITERLLSEKNIVFESILVAKDGTEIPVEINASIVEFLGKEAVITQSRDITERKDAQKAEEKNLQVAQSLYDMSKMVDLSEDKIMQHALELSVKFTESEGGYLHFLNDDNISLNLFKWSESVHKICEAEKIDHYPLEEAGIWADCIRKGEPVIHNDYQKEKERKGLPEGHFPVKRHMSVPIFEGNKIVAVAGVGNKEKDYTQNDTMTLSLFMNEMWKLIQRKRTSEKIKESEERYRNLYENATIGIYRATLDGEILMTNPAYLKMLDLDSFKSVKNYRTDDFYKDKLKLDEFRSILRVEHVVYGFENNLITTKGREITIKESAKLVKMDSENMIIEGVVEDITVAKVYQNQLLLSKEKAEAGEKIKSEFLAQMSHEIRTPLNAMLSGIDFIEEETKNNMDEEELEIFSVIHSSGSRIISTIEKILNMSELQAGSYEAVKSSFDIVKEIIKPTINLYQKDISKKNLEIELKVPDDPVVLSSDRYSVTQIFTNLFDNAVKYTEEGKIEIKLELHKSEVLLKVQDTGIGISEEYLQNIFEPFTQESQGYSRPYDGCGLGLALTKKYCAVNGGEIKIESERKVGTEVTVTLPHLN